MDNQVLMGRISGKQSVVGAIYKQEPLVGTIGAGSPDMNQYYTKEETDAAIVTAIQEESAITDEKLCGKADQSALEAESQKRESGDASTLQSAKDWVDDQSYATHDVVDSLGDALGEHIGDGEIHVTQEDKEEWSGKASTQYVDDAIGATSIGWSPVLAVVEDGERRVEQVTDWAGGNGLKPASGAYVGAGGLVDDIADATDIRGGIGRTGADGKDGRQGEDGAPGYTPQKGVDYWTPEDQADIVQDVLDALPMDTSLEARLNGGTA